MQNPTSEEGSIIKLVDAVDLMERSQDALINGGDLAAGVVEGKFTTGGHTGIMVPVFAYGPKAELFSGIMENTDIYFKFKEVLGWK